MLQWRPVQYYSRLRCRRNDEEWLRTATCLYQIVVLQGFYDGIPAIPLADRVATALKDAFFSGKLKPGDALVERQLAHEMKVGTPVIREVLIALQGQGFVRRVTNHAVQRGREESSTRCASNLRPSPLRGLALG